MEWVELKRPRNKQLDLRLNSISRLDSRTQMFSQQDQLLPPKIQLLFGRAEEYLLVVVADFWA
jgi:hypothetical protein